MSTWRDYFVGLKGKKKVFKATIRAKQKSEAAPHLDALGVYLQKIGKFSLLNPEEELDLGHKVVAGDEHAKRRFIEANLRLVVNIAKGYDHGGMPLLDLIQEGNIGLIKSLGPGKWDPNRGMKFSIYAKFWIRKFILLAFHEQDKTIRSPENVKKDIQRIYTFCSKFIMDHGSYPEVEVIAQALFPIDKEAIVRNISKKIGHPISPDDTKVDAAVSRKEKEAVGKVRRLLQRDKEALEVSLEDSWDESGPDRSDTFKDDKAQSALTTLILAERSQKIEEVLKRLRPRYRLVLELHYGLKDGTERTFSEIVGSPGTELEFAL